MIATAISVVMLTLGPKADVPHWLQELLAGPLAAKVARSVRLHGDAVRVPGSALAGSSNGYTAQNRTGPHFDEAFTSADPAVLENGATVNACRKAIADLEDAGRYDEAYATVSAFRAAHPGLAEGVLDVAADCAELTGRSREAFQLLVSRIERLKRGKKKSLGSYYLLGVSLASAELGHVYPGQADFCRGEVAMGLSHEGMPDKLNGKLVAGTDAKTTAVLSCLGLGLNCGKSAFLEKALWLDPRNTMAAHALIFRYTVADRPADVRRIATIMVETLQPNDPRRAEFARTLAAAK